MAFIGLGFIIIGLFWWIFAATFFRTYVMVKMWAWFVVPVFHLPQVGMAQMYGLMLLLSMFTMDLNKAKADMQQSKSALVGALLTPFLSTAFIWGVAWMIHQLFL